MFEEFKSKAEGVGAEVSRHATKAEALDFIVQLLQREEVADRPNSYAVWAPSPCLSEMDKTRLSDIPGVTFNVTRELSAQAKIGISQMSFALADTGTLVQDSTAVEQRLVSTLSTLHIAIARTGDILPDLPTLLSRISPAKARYIAMITGPSRTADIERVLTIGVHGPERLVIVFVEELGGTA